MRKPADFRSLLASLVARLRSQPIDQVVLEAGLSPSEETITRLTIPLLQALQAGFDRHPLAALIFDRGGALVASNRLAVNLVGEAGVPDKLELAARSLLRGKDVPPVRLPGPSGTLVHLLVAADVDESPEPFETVYLVSDKTLTSFDLEPARKRYSLTGREVEVLALLTQGLSDEKIASRLGVSPNTVKRHMDETREKMHLPPNPPGRKGHSRTLLVVVALLVSMGIDPGDLYGWDHDDDSKVRSEEDPGAPRFSSTP